MVSAKAAADYFVMLSACMSMTSSTYKTLEPGMISSIEAELRIPEEHIGFRLEDMLLITPDLDENLSKSVPIDASYIQKFMAAPPPPDLR